MRKILAVAMLAAPLVATADTGNELQPQCKSSAGASSQMYCLGYITGVVQTHSSWRIKYQLQHSSNDSTDESRLGKVLREVLYEPPNYCLPRDVTIGQIQKVVFKYFDDNPAELHLRAEFLIGVALMRAFPCRDNK